MTRGRRAKEWVVTLDGVRLHGRPLSGEAARQFQEAVQRGGLDALNAVWLLLRRWAPLSWRNLWVGDNARKVMRAKDCARCVQELLAMPEAPKKTPEEMDDWDRLEALNRNPDPDAHGTPVSLGTICRLVEVGMPAGWYWNPGRWETVDGFAPLDQVVEAWRTLQMQQAWQRINLVRSIVVTKAGERAEGMMQSDVREALGG